MKKLIIKVVAVLLTVTLVSGCSAQSNTRMLGATTSKNYQKWETKNNSVDLIKNADILCFIVETLDTTDMTYYISDDMEVGKLTYKVGKEKVEAYGIRGNVEVSNYDRTFTIETMSGADTIQITVKAGDGFCFYYNPKLKVTVFIKGNVSDEYVRESVA